MPLPPGTSLSWIPPSSLYCTQKSVSRISAAAANLRRAASFGVRPPLAKTVELWANSPAPTVAAPAAIVPFFKNARRFEPLVNTLSVFIAFSFRDSNQTCRFEFWHRHHNPCVCFPATRPPIWRCASPLSSGRREPVAYSLTQLRQHDGQKD